MKKIQSNILLPEGSFLADLNMFTNEDKSYLLKIYQLWLNLSQMLNKIGARSVNLPEGLSEGAFCLAMDVGRLRKVHKSTNQKINTSFDCYDLNHNKRIQVKACSILPDLTTFGPKSQWDELYFLDFYKDGQYLGDFDIYLIPNELIYNHSVNQNETFADHQKQGRRPRFSIYKDLILQHNIKPIKSYSLT
jgi:hypothetical protein